MSTSETSQIRFGVLSSAGSHPAPKRRTCGQPQGRALQLARDPFGRFERSRSNAPYRSG
jgi:hypothetical protein